MEQEPKQPLPYQIPSSPLTRGQVRLILLLLFIQVVMTAQSNYAPGFAAWVKEAWAAHQQAVAHRAQIRKNQAIAGRCLSHTEPGTKVVWEEDPDRAAQLLAGTGYCPVHPRSSAMYFDVSNAFPPIAMATTPIRIPVDQDFLVPGELRFAIAGSGGSSPGSAVVFLHRRKAGGAERLIVVDFTADISSPRGPQEAPAGTADFEFFKSQTFRAISLGSGEDGSFSGVNIPATELSLAPMLDSPEPQPEGTEMRANWSWPAASGQPGRLKINYRSQMRVYAGQPDPADASHFTIAYDLDGHPGVINGWLKADGSIVLEPRIGKRVNTIWYPNAK
jgi:hypothetical protein